MSRIGGAVMAFVAGYVFVNTLFRFDTTSSAQTGNLVRLGVRLANFEWEALFVTATSIGGFMLGAGVIAHLFSRGGWLKAAPCALLPGALVFTDCLCEYVATSNTSRSIVSSLAAFSMGGQNVVTMRTESVGFNTSFFTGTSKRIGEAVELFVSNRLRGKELEEAKMMGLLWLSFVFGAGVGSTYLKSSSSSAQAWSLCPAAALQAAGLIWLQQVAAKRKLN
jgi:uncharacterized membrane protein YoaK (UPF0700 family)